MKKLVVASIIAASAVAADAHAWGRTENVILGAAALTYFAARQPEIRVQNYPVYPQYIPQARPQVMTIPAPQYYQRPMTCVMVPVRDDTPYQTGSIVTSVQQCY